MINKIFLFVILLIGQFSCSSVKLKPLVTVPVIPQCEFVEDHSFSITKIHRELMVYRPEISRTVYLVTDWGNPEKTLKIYKYTDSGFVKYVLLFHIKERNGDDYKERDTLTIITDGKNIKRELINDASVIIADFSDLYFYAKINEEDYKTMMNAEKVEFLIMKYRFRLGAECKTVVAF